MKIKSWADLVSFRGTSQENETEIWYSLEPSYSNWALASGTPYEFHPAFFNSTGTVGLYQPMQTYEMYKYV